MEFLFPKKSYSEDSLSVSLLRKQEFLKEVIDLVFLHQDKYYIVNWMSHWLGPDPTFYGTEHMEKVLKDGGRLVQARVHIEALKRYTHVTEDVVHLKSVLEAFILFFLEA